MGTKPNYMKGFLAVALFLAIMPFAIGQDAPNPAAPADPAAEMQQMLVDHKVMLDTLWTLITAMLVFWMNAGFGLVESGFCRSKNAVNILSKNFIVFAVSVLAYWVIGFGLMYSDGGGINSIIGTKGFLLAGEDNSPAMGDAYAGIFGALNWTGVPLFCKFFFQLVFAGTCATIVSGAVAERIIYQSFILFAFLLVALIYPVGGHWIWGGGWLSAKGFFDFAGSTVVHSVGGWAALAGVMLLGPRIGKYKSDGNVHPIPGHNMTSAFLGCMILWLGWYGFNPGSTMAADPKAISQVAMTTTLAAATGLISGTITIWLVVGKPDLGMAVNGCLAGLVAITAPCAFVGAVPAAIIGVIGGIIVVFGVLFFDKIHLDDPVGALSVHLLNGIWGTLAVGLFASKDLMPSTAAGYGLFMGGGPAQFIVQLIGVIAVGVFSFVGSIILWLIVKAVFGLRVSREEEMAGLDITEMGMEAYPGDSVRGG